MLISTQFMFFTIAALSSKGGGGWRFVLIAESWKFSLIGTQSPFSAINYNWRLQRREYLTVIWREHDGRCFSSVEGQVVFNQVNWILCFRWMVLVDSPWTCGRKIFVGNILFCAANSQYLRFLVSELKELSKLCRKQRPLLAIHTSVSCF